jgi:hypothetical protein
MSLSDGVKPVSRLCDPAAQDVHLAGIANVLRPSADPLLTLLNRADQHRDLFAVPSGSLDQARAVAWVSLRLGPALWDWSSC